MDIFGVKALLDEMIDLAVVAAKENGGVIPDVLNDEGEFVGFDIVISNPPYIRADQAAIADMRKYMVAFADSAYQNPVSLCPHHHMMLPRLIKG